MAFTSFQFSYFNLKLIYHQLFSLNFHINFILRIYDNQNCLKKYLFAKDIIIINLL